MGPVFGFRVLGLGVLISDFGFRVSGFGFRVSGFGFRVSGFMFRVSGFGFRVSGFKVRFSVFGCRVSHFEFGVLGSCRKREEPRPHTLSSNQFFGERSKVQNTGKGCEGTHGSDRHEHDTGNRSSSDSAG